MTEQQIEHILAELLLIKKGLPNGELKELARDVKDLKSDLEGLKQDFFDLKEILLDPTDGVIVKTNKNTDFRRKLESEEKIYREYIMEFINLQRWQGGVNKALWILFGSVASIILALFMGFYLKT